LFSYLKQKKFGVYTLLDLKKAKKSKAQIVLKRESGLDRLWIKNLQRKAGCPG
jgi:hypothetical protein